MANAGFYRRCHLHQVTGFLTSPFIIGIFIGLFINFTTRTEDVAQFEHLIAEKYEDDLGMFDADVIHAEKQQISESDKTKQDDNKGESEKKEDKIFVRPRFVKEELNITKKLLVVIVAESDWNGDATMKKYYNDTLHPHITDIAYLDKSPAEKTDLLDIVKKLSDTHLAGYQFYYIVPDTALVISRNLRRMVDPLLTVETMYMGEMTEAEEVCQYQSGLLISHHLIKGMNKNMDWCYRNKIGYDQSLNLQNCIFHSTKVKCSSYSLGGNIYQTKQHSPQLTSFDDVITVHGVSSKSNMKLLMQNLKLDEVKQFNNQLVKLETELYDLINTSKYDLSSDWPTGSVMNFKSWDRYDMGIYQHFNQSHNFFADDYESGMKLSDRSIEDVGSLLNLCNLQPEDFSSGWSRLDATRGTDMILEVSHRANDRKLSSRKCQVVKELANPEIVQMPFVTESYKISLIIPVQEKDSQKTMTLLRSFAKNSIEKNDRIFLMLVFLYTPERPDKNNNNDFFKEVKQLALQISKKYKKDQSKSSSHLLWYSMQTKGVTPSDIELMDLVTQKLDNKTIILLGSPNMEIKADYFNRVRMNTIQSKQVFCPIPFTEYHPSIVYGDKRPPSSLVFNISAGHFDSFNLGHVSFYKSDYLLARQEQEKPVIKHESELQDQSNIGSEGDLCQLFRQYNSVHSLRAPDPSLLLRYEEVTCDDTDHVTADVLATCKLRKQRSFAKRRTLGAMVLDQEAKSPK